MPRPKPQGGPLADADKLVTRGQVAAYTQRHTERVLAPMLSALADRLDRLETPWYARLWRRVRGAA